MPELIGRDVLDARMRRGMTAEEISHSIPAAGLPGALPIITLGKWREQGMPGVSLTSFPRRGLQGYGNIRSD